MCPYSTHVLYSNMFLQATFAGSTRGKMKGQHFSTADFESLGYHFCDSLLDYCDPDNSKVSHVTAAVAILELNEQHSTIVVKLCGTTMSRACKIHVALKYVEVKRIKSLLNQHCLCYITQTISWCKHYGNRVFITSAHDFTWWCISSTALPKQYYYYLFLVATRSYDWNRNNRLVFISF